MDCLSLNLPQMQCPIFIFESILKILEISKRYEAILPQKLY